MKNRSTPQTTKSQRMGSLPQADSVSTEVGALVQRYFDRYGCPPRGSRILVAVSGGPDSVALLTVLSELSAGRDWVIGVAHVHHGLRGADADSDQAFVRELCSRMSVRFHCRNLRPVTRSPRMNLQAWARMERYRFFDQTAARFGYSHIALAHQLDDRAETVAAAVLDAAGTFALGGIPPVRGNIIRPLFEVSRELIERFLADRQIEFRIDGSNTSRKYQRNRIRHDVLPLWTRENPAIVAGLARMGEQVWQQQRYLSTEAEETVKRATLSKQRGSVILDANRLVRHDPALDPFVLRLLIEEVGLDIIPTPATVARFTEFRMLDAGGATVEQGEFAIKRSQQTLQVRAKSIRARRNVPALHTRIIGMPRTKRSDDKLVARFDVDSLNGEVTVRWPLPADRYQPIGLHGTKKLFDLLADRKVPSFERSQIPVVVDQQGILWPVGHPIAQRARLTNRTRRVLEARLEEGSWKSKS